MSPCYTILYLPANVKDPHFDDTVYHALIIVLGYMMRLRLAGVGIGAGANTYQVVVGDLNT